jgi:hypothetical protein
MGQPPFFVGDVKNFCILCAVNHSAAQLRIDLRAASGLIFRYRPWRKKMFEADAALGIFGPPENVESGPDWSPR